MDIVAVPTLFVTVVKPAKGSFSCAHAALAVPFFLLVILEWPDKVGSGIHVPFSPLPRVVVTRNRSSSHSY